MSAFLERFGMFARSPDARPLADIAADIDAELAFHVEESARALQHEGLEPEPARAEALKRFGDYGRIRRECARTLMGERIMLQRIQIVLTAVLIAAVGLLLWSNHEARASMDAERQRSDALLSRLEEQLALNAPIRVRDRVEFGVPPPLVDLRSVHAAGAVDRKPASAAPTEPLYLAPDGRAVGFEDATFEWNAQFHEQAQAWRHGLKIAERLATLPGAQGVEILAHVWPDLSVEHREQVMKPFVFHGGHPNALEIVALGLLDDAPSVRERAGIYAQTYAWEDLLVGEGRATAWLAEWRDRPVEEVLREHADRWAQRVGALYAVLGDLDSTADIREMVPIVDNVRGETYAKANVDLGAILRAHGLCGITEAQIAQIHDTTFRKRAEKIRSWCHTK